jgi:hypothetical protein
MPYKKRHIVYGTIAHVFEFATLLPSLKTKQGTTVTTTIDDPITWQCANLSYSTDVEVFTSNTEPHGSRCRFRNPRVDDGNTVLQKLCAHF